MRTPFCASCGFLAEEFFSILQLKHAPICCHTRITSIDRMRWDYCLEAGGLGRERLPRSAVRAVTWWRHRTRRASRNFKSVSRSSARFAYWPGASNVVRLFMASAS